MVARFFRRLKAAKIQRTPKRKNRAWIVFVSQSGIKLLSPEYFKTHHPHEDQLRISAGRSERRFREMLFCELKEQPVSYLKRFKLKGSSTYKDLHVFFTVFLSEKEMQKWVRDNHLQPLSKSDPQQEEVLAALQAQLDHEARYTYLQLQHEGSV